MQRIFRKNPSQCFREKSKTKRGRKKDRCKAMHVCRTNGKLRSQNLNRRLTSLRQERKTGREKRRGQERKVGVVKKVKLVTEYLAVLNYGRAVVRGRDRPGRVDEKRDNRRKGADAHAVCRVPFPSVTLCRTVGAFTALTIGLC